MKAALSPTIPAGVYVLAFGIFALVTSELQVTGMLSILAQDLNIHIAQAGYLVSVYAGSMAAGGPLLTLILARLPPKHALIALYATFIFGEIMGGLAQDYTLLMVARIITGSTSSAFFGIALSSCTTLVSGALRGRALAIVLSGIMVGTLLGLPLASVIGEHYGWRSSFWATALLAILGAALTCFILPSLSPPPPLQLKEEFQALRSRQLWMIFSTSFCTIGATFAVFSYFVPILEKLGGFHPSTISILLFLYGASTLLGNHVVGKLAGRHTPRILITGLGAQALLFILLALLVHYQTLTILLVVGIGLVGVSMNPALVHRVMQTPQGQRPIVNSLHASVITLGLMSGTFLSGFTLSMGFSLYAPMWIGSLIAILGLGTLWLTPRPSAATVYSG